MNAGSIYRIDADGIEITVTKKRVRNFTIKIKEDGVHVTAPLRAGKADVMDAVARHREWIEKHLAKSRSLEGKILLLGKAYDREDVYAPRASVKFLDGVCIVAGKDENGRQRAVYNCYKKVLAQILPPLFEKWQKATGLKVNKVVITTAKSYLGRCQTRSRTVRISCLLAAKPESVVDYVVLHEISHLRYLGHQKDFYGFVQKFMPDYKQRVKLMRGR